MHGNLIGGQQRRLWAPHVSIGMHQRLVYRWNCTTFLLWFPDYRSKLKPKDMIPLDTSRIAHLGQRQLSKN